MPSMLENKNFAMIQYTNTKNASLTDKQVQNIVKYSLYGLAAFGNVTVDLSYAKMIQFIHVSSGVLFDKIICLIENLKTAVRQIFVYDLTNESVKMLDTPYATMVDVFDTFRNVFDLPLNA